MGLQFAPRPGSGADHLISARPAGKAHGGGGDEGANRDLDSPRLPACGAFAHELYPPTEPDLENQAIRARMVELAHERRRFGYRRLHALLRREGVHANHKRIHRLYRLAGLAVRRRRRRERVALERQPLLLPSRPNEVWSMDVVMDRLADGRRLKCLTVVDDFTKEALEIALDHGMGSHYVVRVLQSIARFRGKPAAIRTDHGMNSLPRRSISGLTETPSHSSSFNRAGPCRTATSSRSTASFATNA